MGYAVSGKVALVTGANRGIGEALVEALLAAGAAKVYAAARQLDDLAHLIARHGSRLVPLRLDVTVPAQIASAVATATDVQLLVNNAGVAGFTSGAFNDPQWLVAGRREMEVNYLGTFAVSQGFADTLARNGGGAIVNIASIASFANFPMFASYSVSKAATHSLTQATRAMLKSQGTQVFGVYPGPIDTRMAEAIPLAKTTPAAAAHAILEGIAAGREDILPDPMSQDIGNGYFAGPKALERQLSTLPA